MRMTQRVLTALLLCCPVALGCARTADTATANPNDKLTPEQRVTRVVPALQRTVTQNDFNQLKLFVEQARAETGNYPKSLAELPGLQRDLPNLFNAIQNGDVVLAGGRGGVLAYEKSALAERGSVLTTQGIQMMTADELRPLLGGG
jgi:hypothetical protein